MKSTYQQERNCTQVHLPKAYLGKARPRGVDSCNRSRVGNGDHIRPKTYAVSIPGVQVRMDFMSSSAPDPGHALEVCEPRPEWARDVSKPPVGAEQAVAQV